MLIYDVLDKWNEEKIITTFTQLGLVRKILVKSQHKCKSVRITINLKKHDKPPTWLGMQCMGLSFNGEIGHIKLSTIRKSYAYTAYMSVKDEDKMLPDIAIVKQIYKEYSLTFAKIIRIKGKKYVYGYFKNSLDLGVTINEIIVKRA